MDSRIDPLHIVGMEAGDAKILRNAGARVTDDVLRTLVLATHLLGVTRVLVMPHTDCRMASGEEHEIHAAILEKSGIDTRGIEIRTVKDQMKALITDIQRIESYPLLAKNVKVMGAVFSVESGTLTPVI
jgi:carbonic anhydrase